MMFVGTNELHLNQATMMLALQQFSDDQLRIGGVAVLATGVAAVWIVHAAFI